LGEPFQFLTLRGATIVSHARLMTRSSNVRNGSKADTTLNGSFGWKTDIPFERH
jgi:hypothetical protein